MNIIIYGLGSGRLRVERYLKKEHQIIGYSDSFYEQKSFSNKNFYKPYELKNIKYDYIVLCIGEIVLSRKIEADLINLGVEKEKIINFYITYRYYIDLEDKIRKIEKEDYECMVLGISHSLYGINKKYLKYKPLKLCSGRQDLYYNLQKLKKNENLISKSKCIIIDMYTYTYFNYDVSMSRAALEYILENNFVNNTHNFNNNPHYQTIDKEIEAMNTTEFEKVFDVKGIDELRDYIESGMYNNEYYDVTINKTLSVDNLKDIRYKPSSIQKNTYSITEKENIQIFEEILKIIRCNNKDIKIYLVLIPQYIKMENDIKEYEKQWKKRFYDILDEFNETYDFKVLDFKGCNEISSNPNYYCDLSHLNAEGSKKFTQLLNDYID